MTCCGTKIETARNEDVRVTYSPTSPDYTFSTFTAKMQVRVNEGDPDPALLTVTMTPTANGSRFDIYGSSIVLTIKKTDLALLPVADPISDPVVLTYDVIITDGTGFSTRLVNGPFVVFEGVTK